MRPVWPGSSLSAGRNCGSLATRWERSGDSESSLDAHSFCWFCHIGLSCLLHENFIISHIQCLPNKSCSVSFFQPILSKKHTRESVNLYAAGVLEKNKLTSSGRQLDLCKQSPSIDRTRGWLHSTWVYLLTLYFVKNRRMLYAEIIVRDGNATYITEKHLGFPEILFLATKMHVLKSQYRGTWYRVCAIYSLSGEWYQLL